MHDDGGKRAKAREVRAHGRRIVGWGKPRMLSKDVRTASRGAGNLKGSPPARLVGVASRNHLAGDPGFLGAGGCASGPAGGVG